MKERYQYLLFDADDTLFDFILAQQRAYFSVMEQYRLPTDEEGYALYQEKNHGLWRQLEAGQIDIKALRANRFRLYLETRGLARDGLDYIEMDAQFQSLLASHSILLPGARELFETAHKTHILCIVSNGVAETQRRKLAQSGLLPFIRHVFISGEMGTQKPDPAFFAQVFETIGERDRRKYLIIGDQLSSDIKGGQNAGIDTCWFNMRKNKMTLEFPPTYTIERLDALFNII